MPYRKQFPCGHKGFGQYCHRCQAAEDERQQRRDRMAEIPKEIAGIRLTKLPQPVARRAHTVITQLLDGTPYHELGGKQLRQNRNLISIPVGYRYRILARRQNGRLVPKDVLSHEDYNKAVT